MQLLQNLLMDITRSLRRLELEEQIEQSNAAQRVHTRPKSTSQSESHHDGCQHKRMVLCLQSSNVHQDWSHVQKVSLSDLSLS